MSYMKKHTHLPNDIIFLSDLLSIVRNSGGRYIGLDTTQGETINARFVDETNCYMKIYDRNAMKLRTLKKGSIQAVRYNRHEYIAY